MFVWLFIFQFWFIMVWPILMAQSCNRIGFIFSRYVFQFLVNIVMTKDLKTKLKNQDQEARIWRSVGAAQDHKMH